MGGSSGLQGAAHAIGIYQSWYCHDVNYPPKNSHEATCFLNYGRFCNDRQWQLFMQQNRLLT